MKNIQTILIPTDLSEISRASIPHAIEFAKKFSAKLHLLNVLDENLYADYSFAGGLSNPPSYFSNLIEERKQRLKEYSKEISKEVPVETNLRRGVAACEIIGEAKALKADLIIIASHGRTGLSHLFMGSVAERVVRESPCPVLTVKALKTVMATEPAPLPATLRVSPA